MTADQERARETTINIDALQKIADKKRLTGADAGRARFIMMLTKAFPASAFSTGELKQMNELVYYIEDRIHTDKQSQEFFYFRCLETFLASNGMLARVQKSEAVGTMNSYSFILYRVKQAEQLKTTEKRIREAAQDAIYGELDLLKRNMDEILSDTKKAQEKTPDFYEKWTKLNEYFSLISDKIKSMEENIPARVDKTILNAKGYALYELQKQHKDAYQIVMNAADDIEENIGRLFCYNCIFDLIADRIKMPEIRLMKEPVNQVIHMANTVNADIDDLTKNILKDDSNKINTAKAMFGKIHYENLTPDEDDKAFLNLYLENLSIFAQPRIEMGSLLYGHMVDRLAKNQ